MLITVESAHVFAFAAFLLNCFGIIAGRAYHSHCVYLGLLGENEQRKDLDIVLGYFPKLSILLYLGEGLGLLLLIVLIVTGKPLFAELIKVVQYSDSGDQRMAAAHYISKFDTEYLPREAQALQNYLKED